MAVPNLGELIASTDEKREKKPADLVSNANVLYHLMKKRGNVKEDFEGRLKYMEVEYAQNAAYQAIDATEEIDLSFNETLDMFQYSPKQSVVPVLISTLEKAMNRGPSQMLDLIKSRAKTGEKTMINELATDLNGDGTGRSSKAFAGIKSYVVDTVTSGSVGNISRSSYSVIRNVSVDLPTIHGSATDSTNLEDRILAAKNQIWTMGVDFVGYMGSTFFRFGAEALRGRSRITNGELEADGFGDHIVLEGIPFFLAGGFNPSGGTVIAADRAYILHPDAFHFSTYKGYNMQALPDRISTRQLVDVSLRVCIGQFCCSDPARNAVIWDS